MSRLTKQIRAKIVESASKGVFAIELKQIENRLQEIGDKLFWKHIIKPEQYAVVEKLPADFFVRLDQIACYLGAAGEKAKRRVIPMTEMRRFPAWAGMHSCPTITDIGLTREIEKIESEKGAVEANKKEIVQQIKAVVQSVSTVKRLLEVWPECEAFIPDEVRADNDGKQLPMILVANLNAAMLKAGAGVGQ